MPPCGHAIGCVPQGPGKGLVSIYATQSPPKQTGVDKLCFSTWSLGANMDNAGVRHKASNRGARVAQSVQRLTPDFGSGQDLTIREIEPCIGLRADSTEPALDSLSFPLSLPLPLPCSCMLSLKINQQTLKKDNK